MSYPLALYVNYDNFSPNHRVLLAAITSQSKPQIGISLKQW